MGDTESRLNTLAVDVREWMNADIRRVMRRNSIYCRCAIHTCPSPNRERPQQSMHQRPNLAELDKLKSRIQALRAKTIDNGCTEDEALSAATKVAELLDRFDLSLTDVEMREAPCERLEYETWRKKRIPIDGCIGAVANFCDCRVWREKNQTGEARYVFFGLRSDIAVALYLTELIDTAVRVRARSLQDHARLYSFPAQGAAHGERLLHAGHGRVHLAKSVQCKPHGVDDGL